MYTIFSTIYFNNTALYNTAGKYNYKSNNELRLNQLDVLNNATKNSDCNQTNQTTPVVVRR